MLQESKTNELEYQRLSKEEMAQRGILGRLVGICADFMSPTRNGRKYPEKLWENVFNDPIMKERIENGVCYGELGHPADREETDMEKIAVCMAEQPRKGSDGKLRAVFDILDTPNGRILKSLCDYGSTLGISSRGSGDLETDFDGQESVNPDTYNCEGFDVVLIPAVKEARLQYVNEALDKKRYNKTLREKLTESIKRETEENQRVINESLSTLGVTLDESQYTATFTDGPMGSKRKSITIDADNSDDAVSKAVEYSQRNNLRYQGYTNVTVGEKSPDDEMCIYGAEVTAIDGWGDNRYAYLFFRAYNERDVRKYIDNYLIDKVYVDPNGRITDVNKSSWGKNNSLIKKINSIYEAAGGVEGIDVYKVPNSVDDMNAVSLNESQYKDNDVEKNKKKKYTVRYINSVDKSAYTEVEASSKEEARKLAKKNLGKECFRIHNVELSESLNKILSEGYNFETKPFDYTLYIDNESFPVNSANVIIPNGIKDNDGITYDLVICCLDEDENPINFETVAEAQSWIDEFGDKVKLECRGDTVYAVPQNTEWIDDQELDESLSPQEKMHLWHDGVRRENIKACSDAKLNMYRGICEDSGYDEQVAIIDAEIARRNGGTANTTPPPQRTAPVRPAPAPAQPAPTRPVVTPGVPNCFMDDEGLHITADRVGRDFMSQFNNDPDYVEYISNGEFIIQQSDKMANKVADALVKAMDESELSESMIKQNNNDENRDIEPDTYIDEGWKQLDDVKWKVIDSGYGEKPKPQKNQKSYYVKTDTPKTKMWVLYELNDENVVAEDDGTMVEELQKSLDLNKKLDKKIVDLQEKLSVGYAKEMSLQEELEKYKSKVIKLSRRLAEEKVNNDKLTAVQDKKVIAEETCKQLTESVKTKTAKITSLKESVDKKKGQIVSLNEQIQQLMSALDERNTQFESLTEKYETLNKDYQQVKENYSKKMEQQNALVEKYRGVAVKSVNKYIDTQATRLGISSVEIKNRLPESYSFTDIDRVCEDLQEYKLNISNLPFSTGNRLNEGMRIKGTNMNQKTLVPVEDDIDELTLRLAGL